MSQLGAAKVTRVRATPAKGAARQIDLQYTEINTIGKGSFGVVVSAKLVDSADMVAIKKVPFNRAQPGRELPIMLKLEHQNIVRLKYFFYTGGGKEEFVNFVSELLPKSLHQVVDVLRRSRKTLPPIYVKLYMYQLCRALAYVHSQGVCHRDIKPANTLVDHDSALLKLCDFGLAKELVRGVPNAPYVGTRFYRAPEVCVGATDYTTSIDVWSTGCVMAEMLLGRRLFPGDTDADQFAEIVRILGRPTRDQMQQMNAAYTGTMPQVQATPLHQVLGSVTTPTEAIDLVSRLLEYTPNARLSPLQACAHAFFHELRTAGYRLPNGRRLPPLFNFTEQELRIQPSLNATLVPAHAGEAAASGDDDDSAAQPSTSTADGRASPPLSRTPLPSPTTAVSPSDVTGKSTGAV